MLSFRFFCAINNIVIYIQRKADSIIILFHLLMSIQTFLELEKLEMESDSGVILNPIVGPESITGKHDFAGVDCTKPLICYKLLQARTIA